MVERADFSGTGDTSARDEAHARRTDVSAALPKNVMAVKSRKVVSRLLHWGANGSKQVQRHKQLWPMLP